MLKNPFAKLSKIKKLLIIILIVILLPVSFVGYKVLRQSTGVDPNNLPKFIQASFIDLSKITSISKFRSSEGHDYSAGSETCRSMKHYFAPNYDPAIQTNNLAEKQAASKPDGKTDIDIYSPVNGRITAIATERTPIGAQVHIVPDDAPQFTIHLFHVWVDSGITGGKLGGLIGGSHVKAGQKIGVISAHQDTDISVEYGNKFNQRFVSVFEVMPDDQFVAYQERGLKERSDVIITKEFRDAHPLECQKDGDQSFILPEGYDPTDQSVYLSGYVARKKDIGATGGASPTTTDDVTNTNVCSADIPAEQRPPGCR